MANSGLYIHVPAIEIVTPPATPGAPVVGLDRSGELLVSLPGGGHAGGQQAVRIAGSAYAALVFSLSR